MIYLTNPSRLINLKKVINFCFNSMANFNRISRKIFIVWGFTGCLFFVVFAREAYPGSFECETFLSGERVPEINRGFFDFIYMSLQDHNWNISFGFFSNVVELKNQISKGRFEFLKSFVFSFSFFPNNIENYPETTMTAIAVMNVPRNSVIHASVLTILIIFGI